MHRGVEKNDFYLDIPSKNVYTLHGETEFR
jgi:hypothetical protein